MQRSSSDMDDIHIKKALFQNAMKPNWDEVVKIYRAKPKAHRARITKSGDTALHIAVSDEQEDIVEELVEQISLQGDKEALEIKNERGNTPLHLAASLGNERMCHRIANLDPSLLGARNNDNETPLFLAALHGKKDAFRCLHSKCVTEHSYCVRNDGETILHCAISGDYFDLAFTIIHLHPDLVNSVNKQGLSPLQILASKPLAFRSASNLGLCDKIIYNSIFVDELKDVPISDYQPPNEESKKDMKKPKYPDNYQTCVQFFKLLAELGKGFCFGRHKAQEEDPQRDIEKGSTNKAQGHQLFPSNYGTCFEFVKLISKAMLVLLTFGSKCRREMQEKKEKHTWSVQVMNELLQRASLYEDEDDKRKPHPTASPLTAEEIIDGDVVISRTDATSMENNQPVTIEVVETNQHDQNNGEDSTSMENNQPLVTIEVVEINQHDQNNGEVSKRETAILIAAKNGITEMVEKIIELFPVAIHDLNMKKQNIVQLAVENRQPNVYQLLLKRNIMKDSIFRRVDEKGNSALHLAATLGDRKPLLIPGAALQMQWEIKWYEFVKNSMPFGFFVPHNKEGKTAEDVFTETHKELVISGGEWLKSTSKSCSVVAALIATVAFATSTTVPGGVNDNSGMPTLERLPAFNAFAISSLVALCFSVISVVTFLAILTSRYEERDFHKDLPEKLLLGFTSLFVSIASMLVSFCAGHFFVFKDNLKYAAFPVYALACFLVTYFSIAQFPLYFDLIWAAFKKVPQPSVATK